MNFFIKYKKIFLIIGFVIIVFVLGYLLYSVFFKAPVAPTPPEKEEPTVTTPAGLPSADTGKGQVVTPGEGQPGLPIQPEELAEIEPSEKASGGVTRTTAINSTPSSGVTLDRTGSRLLYYNQDDGLFYSISPDGEARKISDKVFFDVENITWSPNSDKAILEYPDGSNIIYDFDNEEQVTLPKHWEDFDFSERGDQIVLKSIGTDPSNRWLAISKDDGTGIKAIESLGENEDIVYPSWSPNNQTIAMYIRGVDFDRQELFFVGLNDENFKSTIIPGRGFEYDWDPNGERLLYSVYYSDNDMKPALWVVDAQGENIGANRKNLKINTWASKCTFADDINVYCAVPEELPEGSGIFPELANETKDNLYQINTVTGSKKLVAIPDTSYNVSDIIVSADSRYLYFTDKTTSYIHKIELK